MTTELTKRERGRGRIFARKDSVHLWCAYYLRGKEHRQSTGETDPSKAEKFLSRKLKDRDADQIGAKQFVSPQQERVTVNQILDGLVMEYESGGDSGVTRVMNPPMKSHLKRLRAFFGPMRAMVVQECHVTEFKKTLKAEGKKNATVNRPLQLLEQAYRIATTSNPPTLSRMLTVRKYAEDNVRKGKFTHAEAEMIFAGLPKYMAGAARFAYETGARAGEILKLKWGYLGQGAISVPASDTKNRTPRSIVLTPQLQTIIESQRTMRAARCELIFHNNGNAIRDYRRCWRTVCVLHGFGQWYCRSCRDADFNYVSVLDAKRVCPKCGLKCRKPKYIGKIFHDFRRSCAHELWKAGNTVEDCMEVTGHKTPAMFHRYADLFSEEEKQARQRASQQRRSEWQADQNKTMPVAIAPARGMVQ